MYLLDDGGGTNDTDMLDITHPNVTAQKGIPLVTAKIGKNYSSTVEPLLADTPNSGHLPYNGQCAMYQLRFPYILYFKNLPIADTSE